LFICFLPFPKLIFFFGSTFQETPGVFFASSKTKMSCWCFFIRCVLSGQPRLGFYEKSEPFVPQDPRRSVRFPPLPHMIGDLSIYRPTCRPFFTPPLSEEVGTLTPPFKLVRPLNVLMWRVYPFSCCFFQLTSRTLLVMHLTDKSPPRESGPPFFNSLGTCGFVALLRGLRPI